MYIKKYKDDSTTSTRLWKGAKLVLTKPYGTYGSGVYIGIDECLMYWVEWNTRKARPAKKSLDDKSPATGRSVKPVFPIIKYNVFS